MISRRTELNIALQKESKKLFMIKTHIIKHSFYKKLKIFKIFLMIIIILILNIEGNAVNRYTMDERSGIKWDNYYEEVINRAEGSKSWCDKYLFNPNQFYFENYINYREFHIEGDKVVKLLGENLVCSIRLESGGNEGLHNMIWFFETKDKKVICIKCLPSCTTCLQVDKDLKYIGFEKICKYLDEINIWGTESDVSMTARDVPTYFLSIFSKGRNHQVVIFALPMYTIDEIKIKCLYDYKEVKKVYKKTKSAITVIKMIEELGRDPNLIIDQKYFQINVK